MPRAPRLNISGATFHVTTRGAAERTIFADGFDRVQFLAVVRKTMQRHAWLCHGYCVMGTHYHLIVETTRPTLSGGMHLLNTSYAHGFNRRYRGRGNVFAARFYSRLV